MYNFYTFKHNLTKKDKNGINIYSRFESNDGHFGCFYHVILKFDPVDPVWGEYKGKYTIFLNKFPVNIKNNIKKAVEIALSGNGDIIIYQPCEKNIYSYLDLVFDINPYIAIMNVIDDIKLATHKIIVSDKFGKQYYDDLKKEDVIKINSRSFPHKTVWSQDVYIETIGKIKINGPFR